LQYRDFLSQHRHDTLATFPKTSGTPKTYSCNLHLAVCLTALPASSIASRAAHELRCPRGERGCRGEKMESSPSSCACSSPLRLTNEEICELAPCKEPPKLSRLNRVIIQ
jgi:hypothetical protein